VRVLLTAYDRASSGVGSYTLELARLLSSKFKVTLLSFDELEGGGEERRGYDVIQVKLRWRSRALPLLTYLRNRGEVSKVLGDFDLVHETTPPWGSDSARLVTTRWGYVSHFKLAVIRTTGLSFPENLGSFPVTLQHYLTDSRSFGRARYVVDVSRESENFVPPPVELRPPKSYSCDPTLKVLFVSRDLDMPRKNLRTLLEASKYLERRVELHLVGRGGGRAAKYVEVKSRRGGVVAHGFLPREELLSLMREVDVLVLPSTYEELGYVGLEAYSVGLPVVASDIPSFRAVFKETPKFPPRDPRELARVLDGLDCERLEVLGRRSRDFAGRINEVALRRFAEVYSRVLGTA
jgi:glycosyltransferase involved in cell wall biosynthesis